MGEPFDKGIVVTVAAVTKEVLEVALAGEKEENRKINEINWGTAEHSNAYVCRT